MEPITAGDNPATAVWAYDNTRYIRSWARWDACGNAIRSFFFAVVSVGAGYDRASVRTGVQVGGLHFRVRGKGRCRRSRHPIRRPGSKNRERRALGRTTNHLAELIHIANLEAAQINTCRMKNRLRSNALGRAVEFQAKLPFGTDQIPGARCNVVGHRRPALDQEREVVRWGPYREAAGHVVGRQTALSLGASDASARIVYRERVVWSG